jgi:hypothetical protein
MKKTFAMVLVVQSILAMASVALAERDQIGGIGSTSIGDPAK